MTSRANPLTERVTPQDPGSGAGWWAMPSSEFRALLTGLGRLGYDRRALLISAGIRQADVDDPDARIPCEALGRILSSAQQTRFTPNLALQVARVTPIGANPLLDYLVLTSDTVGAGVRQLSRYFHLIGSPVVLDVIENANPIRIEMPGAPAPFSVEFVATLIIFHLRTETDGGFAAAGVSFGHQPDDVMEFERALGCPVQAAASWNGLSISGDAWRLPLRRRDPVLRRVLETQANDILKRLPARAGLAGEVQRTLMARVAGGDTRIHVLARELAMSGRTLQRRLAAEGASYQKLLEDARKAAAAQLIKDSTLAIGEVAYLVGYSEPAPFHRAFKRWYGVTPEGFRQNERNSKSTTHNSELGPAS